MTEDITYQFGASDVARVESRALAVSLDGSVWVGGLTTQALTDSVHAGATDAFIRSFSSDGSSSITYQFGTTGQDEVVALAADLNGRIWATGITDAFLDGNHVGGDDVFVRRYESDGTVSKTHQFGTEYEDYVRDISVDAQGNVWVVGSTNGALAGSKVGKDSDFDAFIRRYPKDGSSPQTSQFGTIDSDSANGVAIDSMGRVWVVGTTRGAFTGSNAGDSDVFVRYYPNGINSSPETYQFGSSGHDSANSVAIDSTGSVWVVGATDAGVDGRDAFVWRRPSDNTRPTLYQFGTNGTDEATAVAVDKNDNVWVAGYTSGSLGNRANAGSFDAFVRVYFKDGSEPKTYQFGTNGNDDLAYGLATDRMGNVWVAGHTTGPLGGVKFGRHDVFVRQIAH